MEISAILAMAYRDLLKFLRDPPRIAATFIFPVLFIGVLGSSLQANLASGAGYNFLTFTFTGVLAQTLFQSTAAGIISLIEDRENDFSQEIFVSPISRYSIVFGKIVGETVVSMIQGLAVVAFAFVLGIQFSLQKLLALAPAAMAACLLGGAFGIIILSNLQNQRSANQIFPFIIFPQFFLAGVFSPIKILPWYLDILSRISPMRYAVDLARGLFYAGDGDYPKVVLASPLFNIAVMAVAFAIFLVIGTWLFVRRERNR